MTDEENKEYQRLLDKRQTREGLTDEEYERYIRLVDKAFLEGLPKIAKTWKNGFGV